MRYRYNPGVKLTPIFIIIGINLVLFIATLIAPQLYTPLGLIPVLILRQPWTLVTSMFLHAGFGHIFANMLTLFFFGSSLLRLIGDKARMMNPPIMAIQRGMGTGIGKINTLELGRITVRAPPRAKTAPEAPTASDMGGASRT